MQSPTVERARSLRRFDPSPGRRTPHAAAVALATVLSVTLCLLADALSDYSKLTIIGVIIAGLAWPVVARLTSDPRRAFARLAVVVTMFLGLAPVRAGDRG